MFQHSTQQARRSRRAREEMVANQIAARGIRDPRIIDAFLRVPREQFVPAEMSELAYADRALPIGHEQSISQPYVVALTLQALELTGTETVLEVGTGSGYAAALLSCLASEVYSIERLQSLALMARERLAGLGYRVRVCCGDGTLGLPGHAPYDGIAVAAGGPLVPPALAAQLAAGGRMVIPVTHEDAQMLIRVQRMPDDSFATQPLRAVRFVPLIGEQGEPEPLPP